MVRNDLVNRDDPRYPEAAKPGKRLSRAILSAHGKTDVDLDSFDDAADLLCGMATLQGLALLVLEEKAAHFFQEANSRDFVKKVLPKILERLYPDEPIRSPTKKKRKDAGGPQLNR
jgi:hypothetical protein